PLAQLAASTSEARSPRFRMTRGGAERTPAGAAAIKRSDDAAAPLNGPRKSALPSARAPHRIVEEIHRGREAARVPSRFSHPGRAVRERGGALPGRGPVPRGHRPEPGAGLRARAPKRLVSAVLRRAAKPRPGSFWPPDPPLRGARALLHRDRR